MPSLVSAANSLQTLQHFAANEIQKDHQVDHDHDDDGQLMEAEEHVSSVAHGEEGGSEGERPSPAAQLEQAVGGDGVEEAEDHHSGRQIMGDDSDEADAAEDEHPDADDGHAGQKANGFGGLRSVQFRRAGGLRIWTLRIGDVRGGA